MTDKASFVEASVLPNKLQTFKSESTEIIILCLVRKMFMYSQLREAQVAGIVAEQEHIGLIHMETWVSSQLHENK